MLAALSDSRCIFATKTLTFSSTVYYSPNIRNNNLVFDTVRSIFVTVTLIFYVFAECLPKELKLKYSSQFIMKRN